MCKIDKRAIDITGQKFNHLTAVRPAGKQGSNGSLRWLFKCDCGKHKITRGCEVRAGKIKSCGCLLKYNKGTWRATNESAIRSLFSGYKSQARTRGLFFSLNYKSFKKLTSSDCYYCGIKPSQIRKAQTKRTGVKPYIYNGIDRLDSAKGYIENNCVSCCKYCNHAKSNMNKDDFLNLIERIYIRRINNE